MFLWRPVVPIIMQQYDMLENVKKNIECTKITKEQLSTPKL